MLRFAQHDEQHSRHSERSHTKRRIPTLESNVKKLV